MLSPKSAFLHQSSQIEPRVENDVYYRVLKKAGTIKTHKGQMIYTLLFGSTVKRWHQVMTKIVSTKTKVTG